MGFFFLGYLRKNRKKENPKIHLPFFFFSFFLIMQLANMKFNRAQIHLFSYDFSTTKQILNESK